MLPKALRLTALALAASVVACGGADEGTRVLAGSKAVVNPPGTTKAPPPVAPPAPTPPPPPGQPPAAGGPPTITSYSIAAPGVKPDLTGGSIAVAGDGTAWFTAGVTTQSIGRITPFGNVAYVVTTDPADGTYGTGPLATGPDGNIWFADPVGGIDLAGAIGKIDTMSHHATKFSTPLMLTVTQFVESTSQDQECVDGACAPIAPGTCVPSPPPPPPPPPPPASAPPPPPPPPVVTCQTVRTGPTPVLACTPIAPDATNAWTTTTCATRVTGPDPVTACQPILPTAANAWRATTCTGITPGSQAYALTTGPDGAVWFTEYTAPRIGRFDPATGMAVEFFGLTAPARGIAPGPDGNVWFTENTGPTTPPIIGRITPDGTVTEFTAGLVAGHVLAGIAPGSDGAMWFTKTGTGGTSVGRIDTATGAVTFHATALAGTYALFGGIVAGPDGNIWFTDYFDALLGRVATDGSLAEFGAIHPGSPVNAIAASKPGAGLKTIWFTDPRTQTIGQALLP